MKRLFSHRAAPVRNGWQTCLAVALGLLFGSLADESRAEQGAAKSGVVVEEVGERSALEQAGVRPGDVLLAWERLPNPPANPRAEQGELRSAFDWTWLLIEQAPRGTVVLRGEREGKPKVFRVAIGNWAAKVRPWLPEDVLGPYVEGRKRIAAGRLEEASAVWGELASAAEPRDWLRGRGLALRMGEIWAEAGAWEEALAVYRSALEEARGPLARAVLWEAQAGIHRRRSDFAEAEAAYRSALATREKAAPESLHLARSWSDLGSVAWYRGDLDRAAECFERSLAIRQKLVPESLEVASSLNRVGVVAFRRGNLELAMDYYARALAIRQELAPESLLVAASLDNLGGAAWTRGDLDRAAEYLERGLAIREKLAPEGLQIANSLNNLGLLAQARGDLDRAQGYFEQSLAMRQKLAPGSLDVALSLNNLGSVARDRGALDRAAEYHERALAIRQKLAPGSLEVAASLNNLGSVARDRGDLDRAAEYHERALAIRQRLAPESLDVAASLSNLGNVARDRGDLDRAAEYYERTLAIEHQRAPESLNVAGTLDNLGLVAEARGDPDRAAEHYERALAIQEELAPESLAVAASLNNLGNVAQARDDPDRAAGYYERALAIQEKLAPESLDFALSLNNLGTLAGARGDPDRAAKYCERALAIQKSVAPESLDFARSLYNLGTVERERGDLKLAADYFGRLIEALENQVGKLGGPPETKGGFLAQHRVWYRDAIELFLQMNRTEQAFAILERSRARSFLDLLAERDLIFSADLHEGLGRKRRRIGVEYDRTLRRLSDPSLEKDQEKIATLRGELTRLKRERDAVAEEIRQTSPRFAALHYPQPLDLPEAREILDPGTVLLSYSVGKEQTDLFVVTRDQALAVETLEIGEDEVQREVQQLRELVPLAASHTSLGALRAADVETKSRRLYRLLIEPVAERLATSERVLIIPDGPLHLLPFGALIRETGDKGPDSRRGWQYLAEWKPLHSVLSATVYAELKKPRRRPGMPEHGRPPLLLASFGDPHYPRSLVRESPAEIADARVRSAAERGLFDDFARLPHTRREVERIAAFYPPQAARTYLGEDATEERAKAMGRDVRILHFAVHGYADDRFPLNSGLALTMPQGFPEDRDNGLLQAWEIFERIRLDADLVVLSACESGLGKEQGGEGLIGLTRAFQYAGARTVAASLWEVNDRATAELMVRFHRHLRSGKPKDEALRAAQLELIRGPTEVVDETGEPVEMDWSAPYYWAAFQIIGDWQ